MPGTTIISSDICTSEKLSKITDEIIKALEIFNTSQNETIQEFLSYLKTQINKRIQQNSGEDPILIDELTKLLLQLAQEINYALQNKKNNALPEESNGESPATLSSNQNQQDKNNLLNFHTKIIEQIDTLYQENEVSFKNTSFHFRKILLALQKITLDLNNEAIQKFKKTLEALLTVLADPKKSFKLAEYATRLHGAIALVLMDLPAANADLKKSLINFQKKLVEEFSVKISQDSLSVDVIAEIIKKSNADNIGVNKYVPYTHQNINYIIVKISSNNDKFLIIDNTLIGTGNFSKVCQTYGYQIESTGPIIVSLAAKIPNQTAQDYPGFHDIFLQEFKITRQYYPTQLFEVTQVNQNKTQSIIVMDMLGKENLGKTTTINTTFAESVTLVWQLILQIYEFHNAKLHNKQVRHNDIKPDNIILDDKKENAFVIDFGLSDLINAEINPQDISPDTLTGGTLDFMPPEAFIPMTGLKSDLYSLLPVILKLLGVVNPVATKTEAQKQDKNNPKNNPKDYEKYSKIPFDFIGLFQDFELPKNLVSDLKNLIIKFLQRMQKEYHQRPDSEELLKFFTIVKRLSHNPPPDSEQQWSDFAQLHLMANGFWSQSSYIKDQTWKQYDFSVTSDDTLEKNTDKSQTKNISLAINEKIEIFKTIVSKSLSAEKNLEKFNKELKSLDKRKKINSSQIKSPISDSKNKRPNLKNSNPIPPKVNTPIPKTETTNKPKSSHGLWKILGGSVLTLASPFCLLIPFAGVIIMAGVAFIGISLIAQGSYEIHTARKSTGNAIGNSDNAKPSTVKKVGSSTNTNPNYNPILSFKKLAKVDNQSSLNPGNTQQKISDQLKPLPPHP